MNQRIRELNLQALSEVMNGSDPDRDIDQMYIPAEFTKKFAELIVRDVVDTVKRTQPTSPDFEWAILNNYDLELNSEST